MPMASATREAGHALPCGYLYASRAASSRPKREPGQVKRWKDFLSSGPKGSARPAGGSDRASSAGYRAPRNNIRSQAALSGRRRARICLIILVCSL